MAMTPTVLKVDAAVCCLKCFSSAPLPPPPHSSSSFTSTRACHATITRCLCVHVIGHVASSYRKMVIGALPICAQLLYDGLEKLISFLLLFTVTD